MPMRLAVTALLFSLLAAACSKNKHKFPAENVEAFLSACTAQPGATKSSCDCLLTAYESKYGFAEFAAIEEHITKGHTAAVSDFMAFTNVAAKSCRSQ